MSPTEVRTYYELYWRRRQGFDASPSRKLEELFQSNITAGDRCLDVGCGDGATSGVWLHEHGAAYVGVDISEAAVRKAKLRGLTARQVPDATDLPFETDAFDRVVCVEVLEHLFDPDAAIREFRRVVRPGGRLIATVPNVAHWRIRLDLAVLGRWNPRGDALSGNHPWRDPHVRFFSLRALVGLLESHGLEVLDVGGQTERGLLQFVPGVRRFSRRPRASRVTRSVTARFPTLLAETLYVVAEARS